jgi:hypothetical protein
MPPCNRKTPLVHKPLSAFNESGGAEPDSQEAEQEAELMNRYNREL